MLTNSFHQIGWECPKCGAVWAPSIALCLNCTGKKDKSKKDKPKKLKRQEVIFKDRGFRE